MRDKVPWYEDDVLWEKIEPHIFGPARIEAATPHTEMLLELVDITPGASVLDLCCGVGRHSVELARRGYKVTAVDRTRRFLERAARVADEAGVDIEFVEADMREFVRPDSFDMAINMYTSFGYFEDPADDVRVVKNVSRSVRDGGCFAIELMSKEVLARIFVPSNWDQGEDGTLFLERRWPRQDWGWMDNQWIIISGDDRYEVDFGHRLFSAVELKTLLTEHGFGSAEAHGGADGSPYDQTARRLLVIGRK